jgi:PAS domain S-box-containing protein
LRGDHRSDGGGLQEVLERTTAAALAVSSAGAGQVFEDLALGLARVLGTDAALIAEFVDTDKVRMRSLALALEGRLQAPLEYDVSETPCRLIVGRESRFVPQGVHSEFAPGTLFAAKGFDSYAGFSILNAAGEQLGIIVALNREPIANQQLTEALLKIFAVRAAAELERQRAEAALAASETSYRAIFEASEDAIFVHDWTSGAILDVSPKASELYGHSGEQLKQMRVGDFSANVPPYTEVDAIAHIDRAKASAAAHRFEWHARHRDGHLMWHEVTLKRAEIAGQPRVLAFVRDITEARRAAEALRDSEEQYRAIFNASVDAAILWNSKCQRVDVNPAYTRIYGWEREDVIGRGYGAPRFSEEYEKPRLELVRRALAGESCRAEMETIRKDGVRLLTEVQATPFRHRGEPHALFLSRDITERRRAEEALRASEEQYRAIFNASADALVLRDAAFRIVDVNATYERMSGWTREEVLGIDRVIANPADVAPMIRALHERALAGEVVAIEVPLIRRDGTRYELELRGMPIRHRGEPHVLYMGRDVTGRKHAEEAQRASEEQYRSIFEAAADSLQLLDAEHRVVDVNPAYERMYGRRRQEVLGRTLGELVQEPQREERRALVERALAGEAAELQTRGVRADGTAFDLEVRVIPFLHRGQRHVLGIARDITERLLTEQALRSSEEQYRAIFNASVDGMMLKDAQHRIVDVNAAFLAMHGYRREEMLGRRLSEFIPEELQARCDVLLPGIIAGKPCRIEARSRRRDGATFEVEISGVPMQYDGKAHALIVMRDTTDAKRAEQALRASEEQYRAIFNASADALVLWDNQYRRVDINPAYQQMYGWAREEVIGKGYEDPRFPAEYAKTRLDLVRRALGGEDCQAELEAIRRDGSRILTEVHAIPFRHRGEPHVLAIARNITERKQSEEALRASEEQYRAIFNASADAMLLRDDAMMIVDANPAFLALCGLPREQVVGRKHAPFVTEAHEADAARVLGEAMTGSRGTLQAQTRSFDGTVLDVEVRAIPMLYRGRRHVLAIARNITGEKRAEAERHRFEARLRQAQKMEAIGQLTGGIAHDFNNILASVMGYVVLAEERATDTGDARSVEYLGQALGSCRRARDLIQQMLTFSRGGRGEPRALSLAALVREATPMLRSALPSTLAIEVEVDDAAPAVWMDEVQAHQVLLNLAINARDAMAEGGAIRIAVRRGVPTDAICTSCRAAVSGSYVELSVIDSGKGIDPGLLERIFDPFFSTKAPGRGSGMGLSMVHGIVHEHGGHVIVESDWGKGSRFRILLPEHAAVATRAERPAVQRSARETLHGRVLLVDDEPSVLAVMRETLLSWGLQVEACGSADAAERIFERAPGEIDLLVTDYAMPGVTGIELAGRLRQRRADLPWLLCTGYADADSIARARQWDARAVLKKPIEREELRAAVQDALRHARKTPAMPPVAFSEFAATALAEGFDEVLERRWKANEVLDLHRHPFALKALMVQGELWLTRGDQTQHVRPGDRFEIAHNEPHAERYGSEGAIFWIARRHAV